MRYALLIILCCSCLGAGEPVSVDFALDSPGWGGEVIALPPGFAPDMRIQGVEDIRFAPGMFKPDAEDFFSYIFVITSTTGQSFDATFLQAELLTYYKGLANAVSKGSIDTSGFTLKLSTVKSPPAKAAYTGSLLWVEPFATRKAQTLRFDVSIREASGREYLIVCVSPQPFDHGVWQKLHTVRATFRRVVP